MPRGKPFQKGYDPRRHQFTQEEQLRGYEQLCAKISLQFCCGDTVARRIAFRRMLNTEAERYGNPALKPQPKTTYGLSPVHYDGLDATGRKQNDNRY